MTGLLRVTQAALKRMLIQGRGNIINVASSYGVVSPNQQLYRFDDTSPQTYKPIDYVGTKSAIPNITRYLATLYRATGSAAIASFHMASTTNTEIHSGGTSPVSRRSAECATCRSCAARLSFSPRRRRAT